MPTQELNFSIHADGNGLIRVVKTVQSPLKVVIHSVSGTLQSGQPGREHALDLTINGETIVQALLIREGAPFTYTQTHTFARGPLAFQLQCSGFAPQEPVSVAALVNFSISLF